MEDAQQPQWVPDENVLREIETFFTSALEGKIQGAMAARFTSPIRQLAGLQLKQYFKQNFDFPVSFIPSVFRVLYETLADPTESIRVCTGNVLSVLFAVGDRIRFPRILTDLVVFLEAPELRLRLGAIFAINMILQDHLEILSVQKSLSEVLIPRLLASVMDPSEEMQSKAIESLAWLIGIWPDSQENYFVDFVRGLYARAGSSSGDVRWKVCVAFVTILEEEKSKYLESEINALIEYMILCSSDSFEEVALTAGEFWGIACNVPEFNDVLVNYFDRLLPLYLRNMVYTDRDLIDLGEAEENAHVPDLPQDIRPTLDHDDDDEDPYNRWNLRKAFATALDNTATCYRDRILPYLLPAVKEYLFSANWKESECAILALGAISLGCIDGIAPHLPELVKILLANLNSPTFLIRSISCWTLSRYVKWIVDQDNSYFLELLNSLLEKIHDRNKRVQEAACSSFAFLEEAAGLLIVPHLPRVLLTLANALGFYKQKNFALLCDTISTLADSLGQTYLNNANYAQILIPKLFDIWGSYPDDDIALLPLCECFASVAMAFGPSMGDVATHLYNRCLRILTTQYNEMIAQLNESGNFEEDSDAKLTVAGCLDLLAGLIQGLKQQMMQQIQANQHIEVLVRIVELFMQDPIDHVRQTTIAFLGDFVINVPAEYEPVFAGCMEKLEKVLSDDQETAVVKNNAIWACGEMAVKFSSEQMRILAFNTMRELIKILDDVREHPELFEQLRSILENTVITIGRYGFVLPDVVASELMSFIREWIQVMSSIPHNGEERESALLGLCRASIHNKDMFFAAVPDLTKFVLLSLPSFNGDIATVFRNYLQNYKAAVGQAEWNQFVDSLARLPSSAGDPQWKSLILSVN